MYHKLTVLASLQSKICVHTIYTINNKKPNTETKHQRKKNTNNSNNETLYMAKESLWMSQFKDANTYRKRRYFHPFILIDVIFL